MKVISLVKSEFLKNYNIKKLCIITLILIISSIILTEFTNLYYDSYSYYGGDTSVYWQDKYNELSKKDELTLEDEFDLYSAKIYIPINKYFKEKKLLNISWEIQVAYDLAKALEQNYTINIFKENRDNLEIETICNINSSYFESSFQGEIHHLCNSYNNEELESLYLENNKIIDNYTTLLKEDKYYLYVKYLMNNDLLFEDEIKISEAIISNKVESITDFRALNYNQYINLPPISDDYYNEDEFNKSDERHEFSTYKDYIRYNTNLNKDVIAQKQILLYSTLHNIKHDLSFDKTTHIGQDGNDYFTSKTAVNQVFHLSLIVLIIVSVTSSKIISEEHSKGTIKNIITAPVKRWKILFSKFIYLILHTYIIWLIGLIVISLYAGFRFGFYDLFTPKLIYTNGQVIEINYYLYLLKDLFIASIPVIAFLSILFFLSSVTLNTALTTSVTTILSILPVIMYYLCANFKSLFIFLTKTPFMYFDCGFIFGKQEFYTTILKKTNMSLNYGILISLITIIVLYTITNVIYIKRDIKN